MILTLHKKTVDLVNLTKALTHGTPTWIMDTSPMTSRYFDVEQKCDLLSLAQFKRIITTVENGTYFTPQSADSLELKGEYNTSGGPRQDVWIEWREYPILEIPPKTNVRRADNLGALLNHPSKPDILRVPRCLGYFHDSECEHTDIQSGRLGFVFEKPPNTTPIPVSLRELLKTRSEPSPAERVALAKAISSCLMALHSINWLRKNLRSHNIIFFPAQDDAVNYSCPYLSGFSYETPPFEDHMTEIPSLNPEYDIYRHHRTRELASRDPKRGFRRAFDIYSLGVVLVEIVNWRTIDSVLELADPTSLDDATQLAGLNQQLSLAKMTVDTKAANFGVDFMWATLGCLCPEEELKFDFHDDEADARVTANLLKAFFRKVITKLKEVQIQEPGAYGSNVLKG